MTTRVTDGARWTATLVSCVSRLRRWCAHALPLLNLKKKRDCSQSFSRPTHFLREKPWGRGWGGYPTWYLVMLKLSLYKSLILPHPTQPRPEGLSLEIWIFKGKPLGTRLHLTQVPSGLALLQCIGSQKVREDSRARAKSGVQNQISVLSRFTRPRQTTDVVQY